MFVPSFCRRAFVAAAFSAVLAGGVCASEGAVVDVRFSLQPGPPGSSEVKDQAQQQARALMRTRSPDAAYAALAQLEWGKWTSRRAFDHNVAFDLTTWRSGMPYIVGRPTLDADLPVSGTMTYSLAGATKAIDMTTGAIGTLSGSLSVAFQNAQYSVTPNLSIAMPGQTYVTGSGTTRIGPDGARGTFSTMTQNVSGGACAGSACTFSTQGVLTGAVANNAGIVYSLTGPETRVMGAAGFKR